MLPKPIPPSLQNFQKAYKEFKKKGKENDALHAHMVSPSSEPSYPIRVVKIPKVTSFTSNPPSELPEKVAIIYPTHNIIKGYSESSMPMKNPLKPSDFGRPKHMDDDVVIDDEILPMKPEPPKTPKPRQSTRSPLINRIRSPPPPPEFKNVKKSRKSHKKSKTKKSKTKKSKPKKSKKRSTTRRHAKRV
jgi:hypothetical protein